MTIMLDDLGDGYPTFPQFQRMLRDYERQQLDNEIEVAHAGRALDRVPIEPDPPKRTKRRIFAWKDKPAPSVLNMGVKIAARYIEPVQRCELFCTCGGFSGPDTDGVHCRYCHGVRDPRRYGG